MACYPLLAGEKPTGALYILLKSERRFTPEELLSLDLLADQAAVALHNTRRFEGINRALQRKMDELERLHNAEQMISSRSSLEDTLRGILRTAVELTRASHGSFRLLDKRAGTLRLAALSGEEEIPSNPAEPDLPVDETLQRGGLVRQTAAAGADRRFAHRAVERDLPPAAFQRPDAFRTRDPARWARAGRLEGVINLESPRTGAFREDDQRPDGNAGHPGGDRAAGSAAAGGAGGSHGPHGALAARQTARVHHPAGLRPDQCAARGGVGAFGRGSAKPSWCARRPPGTRRAKPCRWRGA